MQKIFSTALWLAGLSLLLTSCGAPSPDGSSAVGQQQLIDEANKALTTSDCATALNLLLPVYNSTNTNNKIRMATASAYGCWATIDYLALAGSIVANSSTLSGAGFYGLVSSLFPSVTGKDHVVEGSLLGMDALFASLKNGVPVLTSAETNVGSFNPGSIYTTDRTDEANIYLVFMSMAGVGGLQNRYGVASAATGWHPTSKLPWNTAATVTSDGCSYAASLLNFIDSIGAAASLVPSSLSSSLTATASNLTTAMNAACHEGCIGANPGYGSPSGCNVTCAACPATLRNRASCTGVNTDVNSCATAGIVNFIAYSPVGGWQ